MVISYSESTGDEGIDEFYWIIQLGKFAGTVDLAQGGFTLQSLDFEQGWPRKQLHTQLLSGVGFSPPAAHRASSELTANSWVV